MSLFCTLPRNSICKLYVRPLSKLLPTKSMNEQSRMVTRSSSKQQNAQSKPKSTSSTAAGTGNPSLMVDHNEKEHKFYIKKLSENKEKIKGEDAVLTYDWENPKLVDLQHTFVPEEFRGKGVAKLLAEAAFTHFVSKGATMKLTCSYLQKYGEDNQEKYRQHIC